MIRRYRYPIISLLLTVAPPALQAAGPWTPFVAKHRLVQTKVLSNGNEVILLQEHSVHRRTSQGENLITRAPVVDGVEQPVREGSYENLRTGEMFQILYERRQAILRARGMKRDRPLTPNRKAQAAPQRVINGIPCTVAPVRSNLPGTSGEGCYSYPYDLLVRSEETYPDGESTIRLLEEYYDVQLGVEPEPAQVRIPAGFEVIDEITKMPTINPYASTGARD